MCNSCPQGPRERYVPVICLQSSTKKSFLTIRQKIHNIENKWAKKKIRHYTRRGN
jgi:hypothetical protein